VNSGNLLRKSQWNESYDRSENHLFSPSDEVVRFVARFIRKRKGPATFEDVSPGASAPILDACCGIGRNIYFGYQMQLDIYGFDLSDSAIATAHDWLSQQTSLDLTSKVIAADIRTLPWHDEFFGNIICDSALDSMPFSVATEGIKEFARVLKPGGHLYCSLISGDETGRPADFSDEEIVSKHHEQDTIQSYFNGEKIRRLLEPHFEIIELQLTQIILPLRNTHKGRWHVTAKRSEV
jgi:ubiquinone/menaquinone biosynthesis C-methylase UbiE